MTRSIATEATSELVQKGLPCDECSSSDAVALYDDGHRHCFSCGHHYPADGKVHTAKAPSEDKSPAELMEALATGRIQKLSLRHLSQETCRVWDYRVRQTANGSLQQIAPYRDSHGSLVGIKIRDTGPDGNDKEFRWLGESKGNLYGRHLWGSGGGRMLTITEGELDALSISQTNDHKYPVVSIPNGAAEAAKAVAKNLEWVCLFDKVIIAFDADAQGQSAAREVAAILPPGKAFIVSWPHGIKDASDLLQSDRSAEITRAIWNAAPYRPDGIIDARDLTEQCLGTPQWGIPWPWEEMTKWTFGRQVPELIVWGAGFGIGKTDALSEIIASTITGTTKYGVTYAPEGFALFGYEAGAAHSKKAIAGKIAHRRFHLPQDDSGASWTEEELVACMAEMDGPIWAAGGKLFINDSKGCSDWDTVKDRMRYLRHAEAILNFAVDPLSAMVEEDEAGLDERKLLDRIIREAAKLTVELSCRIIIFSHLTRPKDGPPHEEGGQVHSSQFRGSNAIGMFADFLIGQERNTQADSPAERCETTFRSVKDRRSGLSVGSTFKTMYDVLAGTLDPMKPSDQFVGDV